MPLKPPKKEDWTRNCGDFDKHKLDYAVSLPLRWEPNTLSQLRRTHSTWLLPFLHFLCSLLIHYALTLFQVLWTHHALSCLKAFASFVSSALPWHGSFSGLNSNVLFREILSDHSIQSGLICIFLFISFKTLITIYNS